MFSRTVCLLKNNTLIIIGIVSIYSRPDIIISKQYYWVYIILRSTRMFRSVGMTTTATATRGIYLHINTYENIIRVYFYIIRHRDDCIITIQ